MYVSFVTDNSYGYERMDDANIQSEISLKMVSFLPVENTMRIDVKQYDSYEYE